MSFHFCLFDLKQIHFCCRENDKNFHRSLNFANVCNVSQHLSDISQLQGVGQSSSDLNETNPPIAQVVHNIKAGLISLKRHKPIIGFEMLFQYSIISTTGIVTSFSDT